MPEQVDKILSKITGTDNVTSTEMSSNPMGSGSVFYCDARNQMQLNDFIDDQRPKLVALVGFAGYGKSTFIGSLYHVLTQRLSYNGFSFVDSETYVGFERRVFLRRVNKDNSSDTKRTILGENDILDMKLRTEKGISYRILISDKAGETYQTYLSKDKSIEGDVVIENSDLLLFFVDADFDSRSLAKHNLVMDNYRSLLTRLKEKGKIGASTAYALVYTKSDLVATEDRKIKLESRKTEIKALFEGIIGVTCEQEFEVNSKAPDNEPLNDAFVMLIRPLPPKESVVSLNWVKDEIETEQ